MDTPSHLDFVRNIAKAICTVPDAVEVEDKMDERGVLIQLFVDKADLGRMIGKGGEGANAIRLLLRAVGAKNNAHYGFKVDARPYSVGP